MKVYINGIPIINSHEHIGIIYRWPADAVGLVHLLIDNHYLMGDVAAADPANAGKQWVEEGATPTPLLERTGGRLSGAQEAEAMEFIIDRLPRVAMTSDWKAFQYCLRDLYGLSDWLVTRGSWKAVDARVKKAYAARDRWYDEVFERARFKKIFWCYGKPPDKPIFRGVPATWKFLEEKRGDTTDAVALAARIERYVDGVMVDYNPVAFKFGLAGYRDVAIAEPDPKVVDAELRALSPEDPLRKSRAVDDFFHETIAEIAGQRGVPVQIHTGILVGNILMNQMRLTYASRMEPFLARHTRTRFDVFHGSYAQWGEAIVLARRYPNVHLNFCYLPSLSEAETGAMLDAALDAVPVNKFMWGGDAHSPEMAYGVALLFREILARALERRAEPAKILGDAAEWILWRSAAALYGVSI